MNSCASEAITIVSLPQSSVTRRADGSGARRDNRAEAGVDTKLDAYADTGAHEGLNADVGDVDASMDADVHADAEADADPTGDIDGDADTGRLFRLFSRGRLKYTDASSSAPPVRRRPLEPFPANRARSWLAGGNGAARPAAPALGRGVPAGQVLRRQGSSHVPRLTGVATVPRLMTPSKSAHVMSTAQQLLELQQTPPLQQIAPAPMLTPLNPVAPGVSFGDEKTKAALNSAALHDLNNLGKDVTQITEEEEDYEESDMEDDEHNGEDGRSDGRTWRRVMTWVGRAYQAVADDCCRVFSLQKSDRKTLSGMR